MPYDARALRTTWDRQPSSLLDAYLIQHVENPCINAQSVLLRGLLIDALFPDRFTSLIREEMRYAACALTCLRAIGEGWDPASADAVDDASPHPADRRSGRLSFLRACRRHGLDLARLREQLIGAGEAGWETFTSPFEERWRSALAGRSAHAHVLELACGSANDARYYARNGLQRFLSYTGIDLCPKNLRNAARHVPEGRFLCCDARALPFADESYDYVLACDLLEHLPEWGIDEVLCEAARVARDEIWLSLFNAGESAVHEIRPTEGCYQNRLSLPELQATLRTFGFDSYAIDVPSEWAQSFPGYEHYNPQARLLVAARSGAAT